MPIPALIGAAAAVIGNMVAAKSQKSTNDYNLHINQLNNEFNERMMHEQMDYNTMMWKKQNAYNDPSAQRARLENAGLNPYMMLNGGNAGNAQAAGSTSAASAAPSAPAQAFHPDFSGIPQAILMAKQGKNIDADTQRQVIDNQTLHMRNMQQFMNMVSDTKSKEIQNKLQGTILNYADQMQREQLRQLELQNDNILREILLRDKNLSIFDEQTRLDFAQRAASVLLTNAQTKATKQQTVTEIQKVYQMAAQTQGIKIQNNIAQRTAQAIVDRAYNEEFWSRKDPNLSNGYRFLEDIKNAYHRK